MNIKKTMILVFISAVVIGISAMTASAEDLRVSEAEIDHGESSGEKGLEEPLIIAPNPYVVNKEDEVSGEDEILPLIDGRNEQVIEDIPENRESDPNIILGNIPASKDKDDLSNSEMPVIIILGIIGLLIVFMIFINIRK